MTRFEDALKLAEDSHDIWQLQRNAPKLVEGLHDLANRLKAIETSRLQDMQRMQKLEALTAEEKTMLDAVAKDRTELQHQNQAQSQRLDALEAAINKPAPPYDPAAKTPPPYDPSIHDPKYPNVDKSPGFAESLGFVPKNPNAPPVNPPPA